VTEIRVKVKVRGEIKAVEVMEGTVYEEVMKRADMECSDGSLIVEIDFSSGFIKYKPGLTESGKQMVSTFLSKS
jgi:hypothetical protein